MEKTELTEGTRSKLRAFIHSAEGVEFKLFMQRLAPQATIDYKGSKPMEVAALTGARTKGWNDCMAMMEDISDPDFGKNKNLK